MSFLFSLHDTKALCVISLSPSSSVSVSVIESTRSRSGKWLQSKKLHQSHTYSHSSCVCAGHFTGSQEVILLSRAHVSHRPSGACVLLTCMYHAPFIMTRKAHNQECHWSSWLVPNCLHYHIWHKILFWMRSHRQIRARIRWTSACRRRNDPSSGG